MKKQHKHSDKRKLTWQLIRDYFSNSLANGEMHEVEKRAMHDPFNSDAFDGLEDFAAASIDNDLNNLRSRLNRKSGYDPNKKQVPWDMLLRVAAVVVLVFISSGVVIYLTRNTDTLLPTEVAQEKSKQQVDKPTPFISDNPDSGFVEDDLVSDAKKKMAEEDAADKATQAGINRARTTRQENLKEPLPVLEQKQATSVLVQIDEEAEKTVDELDMVVADESNVGFEIQMDSTIDKVELTETAPEEKSGNVESALKLEVTPAKAKQRTSQSAVAAKPPEDMDAYKGSIFRKIMEEEPDAIGEFEVWFTVDEKGRLSDFEVTKSIDRRTDRKIIREIKRRGNWEPAYIASEPTKTRAAIQLIF